MKWPKIILLTFFMLFISSCEEIQTYQGKKFNLYTLDGKVIDQYHQVNTRRYFLVVLKNDGYFEKLPVEKFVYETYTKALANKDQSLLNPQKKEILKDTLQINLVDSI